VRSIATRAVAPRGKAGTSCGMTTLAEIESAVETLPKRDQRRLLKYLNSKLAPAPPKKPSLHDRMKDGCGIVDSGVPDLATNPKHMEGFGKWRTR
jgi:hypothetical protein